MFIWLIDWSFVFCSFDVFFVLSFYWSIFRSIIRSIVRSFVWLINLQFNHSIYRSCSVCSIYWFFFVGSIDQDFVCSFNHSILSFVYLFIRSTVLFSSLYCAFVQLINAFARSFNESIYLRRLVCSLICSVGRLIRLSDCLNTSFICRQRLHNSVAEN